MTTHTTPRALVIDDDPEMRSLHKRVLTQLGFEVVLTSNATDGIEAVRQFAPAVTFLDVTMPGMDGFAAAARIREFSDTYLLIVSANSDEIDVVQGLAAGADDYIFKPFRPRELRARVEALMRRSRTLAPSAPEPVAAETSPDVWRPGLDAPVGAASVAYARADALHEPTVLRGTRLDDARLVDPDGHDPHAGPLGTDAPGAGRAHGQLHSRLHGLSRMRPGGAALARAAVEEDQLVPVPGVALPQLVTLPRSEVDESWVRHGSLALDPARSVVLLDGEEVELPPTEFALLSTLVESGTRVRSIAHLVLSLRGETYVTTYYVNEADKSAVKAHMASLLRSLGDTGTTPRWIEQVRGVGYRMTAV